MSGVFVTGTDTGIGKTLVSAWLTHHWRADYWKPVQSGAVEDSDSGTIAALAPGARIHPPAYVLQAPLSPHEAAALENIRIDPDKLVLPKTDAPLVVEGAGGLMVPLNESVLTVAFVARLGLPVVLVARPGLGTINHTLLSIEALRHRSIPLLGVILCGGDNQPNRAAIEHFGGTRILAALPALPAIDAAIIEHLPPPDFLP